MTDDPGSTARSEVGLFALRPGASIGRYTIASVLGQGGFGITYRAHDTQLHRDVAIKEYLPSSLAVRQNGITVLPRSTEVAQDFIWGRDRFVAEGRTLASLTEAPAIVRVFDFLEANGTAYIVMELVPGETLDARLRRLGPLSPPEVDALLLPLLDGLEQVHAAGFLHRDIKPANILLRTSGRPVLIDFGASRAAMAGRSSLMTAIFTPGFAAAEQMTSAKQGPWTDIYALAATIYLAITGTTPPPAIDRMIEDEYRPLAALKPLGFSPALVAAIDAGLAVRHVERPQSIAAWRALLHGSAPAASPDATVLMRGAAADATVMLSPPSLGNRPSVGAPPSITPTAAPPARRPWLHYAGLGALALLLMTGGGYLLQDKPKPPQTATVSLQDMKVEDLEKALEARRKADAEAEAKRKQEEEARAKVAEEAEARNKADADLAKIREERQELERLRAQLEEQKKQADTQRQAQIEEDQRRANAAAEAKRRDEEEAQKKADQEARQQAEAEKNLARIRDERAKADADARAKREAENKQKADADAKTRAEAEAREKEKAEKEKREAESKAKQDAEDKTLAEAAETALRLSPADRQRLQVALTSQGFDTRGSDGAFGPRTREMVAAWQKARNLPATGFVNAAQQQQLQREAAAALQKYDDDQKPAGSYGGSLSVSRPGSPTSTPVDLVLQIDGAALKGTATVRRCGSYPVTLALGTDGPTSGQISGTVTLADFLQGCSMATYTASGKTGRDTIEITLSGPGARIFGSLRKGFVPPPPTDIPSTPDAPQATAPAASSLDGAYGGSSVVSNVVAGINLQVNGGSANGTIGTAACSGYPFTLLVSPTGQINGTIDARIGASSCIQRTYSVTGRVADGTVTLDLRSPQGGGRLVLNKGVTADTGGGAIGSAPSPSSTSFDGAYGGNLSLTRTGSAMTVTPGYRLRIAGAAANGEMLTRNCGTAPFTLAVSADGRLSGAATLPDGGQNCSTSPFSIAGRMVGDAVELTLTAAGARATGTLRKGAGATPGGDALAATPSGGWTGTANCNTWPAPLRVVLPAQGGQINSKGSKGGDAVTTVNVTGDRYEGSIKFTLPDQPKTLSATFSGAVVDRRISLRTIARADFKNLPGANEDFCTLEIALSP